jgi:hypothetical protein
VITDWLFYSVPERLKFAYVILLVLNMFIIPEYVLNVRLNIAGEFLNFLTFDLLFYVFSRTIDFNKEE